MKQVLFICSANYYRSRFAEHLFNWLAPQVGLTWQADSRGLLVDYWGDLGSISHHAVAALKQRGIPINGDNRDPQPVTVADLSKSQLIVAVKESEHLPLMTEQFPDWANRVEYWHIDDLDCAEPEEALPLLETQVRRLVDRLGNGHKAGDEDLEPGTE